MVLVLVRMSTIRTKMVLVRTKMVLVRTKMGLIPIFRSVVVVELEGVAARVLRHAIAMERIYRGNG